MMMTYFRIFIHIFFSIIFCCNNLSAEYLYPSTPDSVMMQIETKYKTLKEQVEAIEEFTEIIYHTDHRNLAYLNFNTFFAKYEKKIKKLNNNYHSANFFLSKGQLLFDPNSFDSSLVFLFKAYNLAKDVKNYPVVIHSSLFIGVANTSFYPNQKTLVPNIDSMTSIRNKYFREAFSYSMKTDDLFAKAAASWSYAEIFKNINKDSVNYYLKKAIDNLDKLPDNKIHLKYFGFRICLEINNQSPTLKDEIKTKLLLSIHKLKSTKLLASINYDLLFTLAYFPSSEPDSAAKYAYKFYNSVLKDGNSSSSMSYLHIYIYKILYILEKEKGNFEDALKFHEIYLELQEKQNIQDERVTTLEIEKKLEQKQFDKDKKMQSERQLYLIVMIAFIVISLLIVIYFIYKRYKDRQRIGSELEKLILAKDKLFSIVSHDLRNPVASLKQMLDIVVLRYDKLDDESKHKYISNLRNSSNKLFLMLDNLLSWARINLGQIRCVRDDVDVFSIISNELEILEDMIESKNLKINLTEGREAIFNVDANIFRIIFRNIITNAIKFSPYNGKIDIELDKSLTTLNLKVRDFGAGISSETIAQIKSRAIIDSKSGTANERGNGLGLTIVSELVKLHNGEIEIESKLGEGTVVKVSFDEAQN